MKIERTVRHQIEGQLSGVSESETQASLQIVQKGLDRVAGEKKGGMIE